MRPSIRALLLLLVALLVVGGVAFAVRERRGGVDEPAADDPRATAAATGAVEGRRQQLIGVRTARASRGTLGRTIRTVGTVRYDETRLTDLNLKLDGWITELHVDHIGQTVTKGQALFKLYSPELLAAQNDLVVALRNRDQVTSTQAADSREYGARLVEAPRQRLVRWDVPEDQLRLISEGRQPLSAVVFRSPAGGVVIDKTIINGMQVKAGETLYRIADLSVVWIEAEFREFDLPDVREGAEAVVTTDAWPGVSASGRIVHVFPYMNEQTRTVKARIALANRGGRLRPGMFANVEVGVKPREGLLIPADAVVDSGTRQTVFVAQGNGHYEPRPVTVGGRSGGQALIVQGLRENEEVAERGTFFLDSESQLRAGLQSYQPPPSADAPARDTADVSVSVQTVPDPPRSGENIVDVRVKDSAGRPVSGADVLVQFSMPAMPSMNMPAMRAEARLDPVGEGRFRGPVSLSMAGRWDVNVTVRRQGRPIATRQSSVLAR
jgi:RND family efflux transporter MFP subunit